MRSSWKDIQQVLRELMYILNKKQKIKGIVVFIMKFISGFVELLGISAIIPFIYVLLDIEALKDNVYMAQILKVFHITTDFGIILLFSIGMIVLYIVKNIYMLATTYSQNDYSTRIQKDLSTKLFCSYMKRPYTFFLDINSSTILRNINGDIQAVSTIVQTIFTLLSDLFLTLLLIVFFFVVDVYLAMGLTFLAVLCFGIVTMMFKKKMRVMGVKQRQVRAARNKSINQSVNGIKEIMVMQRKENVIEEFDKLSEEKRKTDLIYGFSGSCPERILEGICVSGLIATVCIRIGMGGVAETFIPSLAAFGLAAVKLLPSLARISRGVSQITFLKPSLHETYESIKESELYIGETQGENLQKLDKNNIFNRCIEIKKVDWQYDNAKGKVLKELSLTINKGDSIAFIGGSGAGKTTLADILLGLLKPQQGSVLVDGTDIFSIPKEWSKVIGYVPQAVFLLDDTVRNNVAFWLQADEIKDELVWNALEQAQLKEFIEGLPKGLDTIVGERGVKFSGGQRQRISIARALYYDPEILVLDEATAALDNETENAIMEAIDSLKGRKTLIIIAHRLTTIQNCSRIYEITDGKAVLRSKEEVIK